MISGLGSASAAQLQFRSVDQSVVEERFSRIKSRDAKRAKELAELFAEAGCPPERLDLQKVRSSRHPNVICTLPGVTDRRIVVGAHFDSVPMSRGAVDNWSGAALLPSLYESLSRPKRQHTFVFIGFTDEEEGRIGSLFYVDQLSEAAASKVRAMINLDSLGLGSTKVWTRTADPRLVATLDRVAAATDRPWSAVDIGRGRDTDSTSFSQAGIPALTIHSLTHKTQRILHTPRDSPKVMDFDVYYDTFQLTVAYLAYLDQAWEQHDKPLGRDFLPSASR